MQLHQVQGLERKVDADRADLYIRRARSKERGCFGNETHSFHFPVRASADDAADGAGRFCFAAYSA